MRCRRRRGSARAPVPPRTSRSVAPIHGRRRRLHSPRARRLERSITASLLFFFFFRCDHTVLRSVAAGRRHEDLREMVVSCESSPETARSARHGSRVTLRFANHVRAGGVCSVTVACVLHHCVRHASACGTLLIRSNGLIFVPTTTTMNVLAPCLDASSDDPDLTESTRRNATRTEERERETPATCFDHIFNFTTRSPSIDHIQINPGHRRNRS